MALEGPEGPYKALNGLISLDGFLVSWLPWLLDLPWCPSPLVAKEAREVKKPSWSLPDVSSLRTHATASCAEMALRVRLQEPNKVISR